ncbi:MAG TPA: hypothetical protein VEC06_19945 [Paucimonas sp.]|nr:hypothetical protein [Paucimonas sp.]
MSEHVEWEVVDEPAPGASRPRVDRMKAMLGRHWKLKLAGLAAAGIALFVFVLMLAGVVLLLTAGVALLSVAIAKLRKLLHKTPASHASQETGAHAGDWKTLR